MGGRGAYREREREREIHIYIYICVCVCESGAKGAVKAVRCPFEFKKVLNTNTTLSS